MNDISKPTPADGTKPVQGEQVLLNVPRPVDGPGLASNRLEVDKSPETAVIGIVPVIAHDKDFARWHRHRSEIITRSGSGRENKGVLIDPVGIYKGFAVDRYFFIPDLDDITGNGDDSFDVIQFRVFGKLKHHDIVRFWIRDRYQCRSGERYFHPIDEFTDQDVIPDLERWQHRTGRNFEGLDNE